MLIDVLYGMAYKLFGSHSKVKYEKIDNKHIKELFL